MRAKHQGILRAVVVVLAFSVCASACGHDDDDTPSPPNSDGGTPSGGESGGGGPVSGAPSAGGRDGAGGVYAGAGGAVSGGVTAGGAGGSSGSGGAPPRTPQEELEILEESGKIPKLERSDPLAGVDDNQDGIRDDIEAIIAAGELNDAQRAASRQFAKVMQDALLVDKTDLVAAKAIAVRSSRAVNCIYEHFDGENSSQPSRVVAELRSISTNTKRRLLAYLAYAKTLNGTSGTLPTGDTCE